MNARDWLTALFVAAVLMIAAMSLFGCGLTDAFRSRQEIEAGPGASVEARTDQRHEESPIETGAVTGPVQSHRYGPSPEQAQLESERLTKEAAERAGVYVIFGAILLIALAAPNVFPAGLASVVFIVGLVGILVGAILPQIVLAIL